MKVSLYLPPDLVVSKEQGISPPKPQRALLFLSGLTCTEDNFITKAGAIECAAALGVMLICPDTSPRGLDIPGSQDSWDFGVGASFYVDATTEPYRRFQMESYIVHDLIPLIRQVYGIAPDGLAISGHSMV